MAAASTSSTTLNRRSTSPTIRTCSAAVPLGASFGEDAFQEPGAGSLGAAFLVGEHGFRGDQPALAGSFQHGGAVPLQIRLHPLKRFYRRIQPRKLPLNLSDYKARNQKLRRSRNRRLRPGIALPKPRTNPI